MSYDVGTSLGRLREMIDDTDPSDEIFDDDYLNDLLSRFDSIVDCAVQALTRMSMSPQLIRKRFKGYGGQLGISGYAQLTNAIQDQIKTLQESSADVVDASSSEDMFPDASSTSLGRATDSDGWWKQGRLDNYLDTLKQRD